MICLMTTPFTGREISEVPRDVLVRWLERVDAKIRAGRMYREHQAATIAEVRRVLLERAREGSTPKKSKENSDE